MFAMCLTFGLVTISSGAGNGPCADAEGTPRSAETVIAAAPRTTVETARPRRRDEGTLRTPLVESGIRSMTP
ncbi:hypothetical protein Acsp05_47600 [Actinokineospora sp. NBRC 105648]|nr:hypothetical protein Acsp05_47600 [Actinokineospora sp. NBRC 105648]